MKVSRKEILEQAVHDCYKEMYAKAQPSIDWDQIVQEFKEGKRDKDERVYEQHYLSQDEYIYARYMEVREKLIAHNLRLCAKFAIKYCIMIRLFILERKIL